MSNFFGGNKKEAAKGAKVAKAGEIATEEVSAEEELELLSKVIKCGAVEEFTFNYQDRGFGGKVEQRQIKDVQAILINPKWADHGYSVFKDGEAS